MSSANESAGANRENPIAPVVTLIPPFHNGSPVLQLQDTLEYAISPRNYLIRKLGKDVIEQRSQLLNIPDELVDRDGYGTGVHKQNFEHHIATLLGKNHGLFFITGVQAQLTAMKIHCDNAGSDRVAWHYRSHLEIAEEHGFANVFHLQRTFVGKSPLEVPTVRDVEVITSLPMEERPAVILLELPNRELGCKTYPYDDLVQISQLCKAANVKLHMDGARLWEIAPFYQEKSFADIAVLFDSVYVSFYKGLTGSVGAMLISSEDNFIEEAKKWQRRLGGNMVSSYPAVIDCERGYNLRIGTFDIKWQKMHSVVSAIMEATKKYRTKDGKPFVYFEPEVPTCCQIHTHIEGVTTAQISAARDEVENRFGINLFKAARPWPTLDEMSADWTLVPQDKGQLVDGMPIRNESQDLKSNSDHYFIEWMIREENINIADDIFAKGWGAFCQLITSCQ